MSKPFTTDIEVLLPVDTAALAVDDVVCTSTVTIQGAGKSPGGRVRLVGLDLFDANDQAAGAYDVVLMNRSVSLGAANGAISVADADAGSIRHVVRVAASDFVDLITSRKAFCGETTPGLVKVIDLLPGQRDLFVSLVVRSGTPTFANGNLTLTLYFEDVF